MHNIWLAFDVFLACIFFLFLEVRPMVIIILEKKNNNNKIILKKKYIS